MSSPALSRHRPPRSLQPDGPPLTGARAQRSPAGSDAASPRLAGRYRYDRRSSTWWWSAEMFALQGVLPETAQPCTEALLEHQHPDDRTRILDALTGACTTARPFTVRSRVLRPDGRQREVVLVGEPALDGDGSVTAVEGVCVDITDCAPVDATAGQVQALQTEVEQMRAAMASRAAIEQAKGILMLLTNCSDKVAFDLLTHISSHTHRKVRDVATSITESAAGHSRLPEDVRHILRDACPPEQSLH
jgi:hypothetical protein